jgi:hypothetical protein
MFKSIFNPDFKYRSADHTDVRLTFARVKRRQRSVQRQGEPDRTGSNVVPIGASPGSVQGADSHWPFPE